MGNEVIKAEKLCFKYKSQGENIINDLSFSLDKGDVLVILGPNGAGKSTLLSCIMSDIRSYEGKILFDGKDVLTLSSKELSRKISFVSQMSELSYEYTVEEMLLMGRTPYLAFFERPSEEDTLAVHKILEENGLLKFKDRIFSTLSGGERQIVLIARALAQDTDVIVLDEPSSALDIKMQSRVAALVSSLAKKGKTVIMTTHNPSAALLSGCKVLLMGKEKSLFGAADELITEQNLTELYGCAVKVALVEGIGRVCISGI